MESKNYTLGELESIQHRFDSYCKKVIDGSVKNQVHRDCGVDTKEMIPAYRRRYAEILEFTHFVQFFIFNSVGKNHKEKEFVL